MNDNLTLIHTKDGSHRRTRLKEFGCVGSRIVSLTCVFLFCVGVAGCSWVPLAPGSIEIRVAENETDVADCKHVGNVRTRTKSRVGFIDRGEKTVSKELHRLAKNEAVEMDADTILAVGMPSPEGTQTFRAYRCSPS